MSRPASEAPGKDGIFRYAVNELINLVGSIVLNEPRQMKATATRGRAAGEATPSPEKSVQNHNVAGSCATSMGFLSIAQTSMLYRKL